MRTPGQRLYAWACERLYAELAPAYEWVAAAVSLGRWDRWRQTVLPFVHGDVVLEIGCGTGRLLPHLAQGRACVIGVDRSASMIRQSRHHLARCNIPHVNLIRAASQALPIQSHCVDTVISTFPAPYLAEAATLREIRRVLQLNTGRLVVAGVWVRLLDSQAGGHGSGLKILQRVPYFYSDPVTRGPSRVLSERFERQGFTLQTHEAQVAGTAVGLLVAQPG